MTVKIHLTKNLIETVIMKKFKSFVAYTDGACSKKGIGGAGLFLYCGSEVIDLLTLKQDDTTNNQMELTGAILALRSFELEVKKLEDKGSLTVFTDSQYVQKGITTWIHNWKKKNWKSSGSTDVLNKDLWITLDCLRNRLVEAGHKVEVKWVRGHDGNIGNEIADYLATNVKFTTMEGYNLKYNPDNKIQKAVTKFIEQADCEIANINTNILKTDILWDESNSMSLVDSIYNIITLNYKEW